MKGKGGQHNIKAAGRKAGVLYGAAAVGNGARAAFFPCYGQHPFRDVQPQHTGGAVVCGIHAVPAVPAPQVQHAAALKRRQHGLQRGPFARARKAKLGACHPAVFFKKYGVVISVFFHAVCLLYIFVRRRAKGAADKLFCGCAQGGLILRGIFVPAGNKPY